MSNAIDDMVEQATEAADAVVPAVVEQGNTAVGAVQDPMAMMMAQVDQTPSLIVNQWMKPQKLGIQVGAKDESLVKEIKNVTIVMQNQQPMLSIKTTNTGNAQYAHSYDGGRTAADGTAWPTKVEQFKALDPKAEVYPSALVVATLSEDIVINEEVIAKAGDVVGNSISKTGFREWAVFVKAARDSGKLADFTTPIAANIGFNKIEHNKNVWGVLTFELVE